MNSNSNGMERIQFSGLTADSFDDLPELGDVVVLKVRARVKSRKEEAMAAEGTRHIATVVVEDCVVGHGALPERAEQGSIDDIPVDAEPDYGDVSPDNDAHDARHDRPFEVV